MRYLLAMLPVFTVALAAYAARPRRGVAVAPARLGIIRAAVAVGAYAVAGVEALGAYRSITLTAVVLWWTAGVLVAGAAAAWRYRHREPGGTPVRDRWAALDRPMRVLAVAVGGLAVAALVLAVLYPPNNFDSQTYHLPKIEHWVRQHSVASFATRIHRQVTYPPGAEYLLLHLRVLTGGDRAYNLLQWCAGLGGALAASRIAAQLGGAVRAQLATAVVVGTTPLVVLESSSTQTDLVVALWVAAVGTLALDGLAARTRPGTVALLGLGTGLTALTKATGLLAAGPMLLLWGAAQLRLASRTDRRVTGPTQPADHQVPGPAGRADQRQVPGPAQPADDRLTGPAQPADDRVTGPGGRAGRRRVAGLAGVAAATLVILGLAAALVGPFAWRVYTDFGNPLGPAYLRDTITMQRHDPAAVLVNALRLAQTALDTPLPPLGRGLAAAVDGVARLLHVDPSDPAITFGPAYPTVAWYPDEDRASYPIQGGMVALATAAYLLRRPVRVPVRAHAAAVTVAMALFAATVKWQMWGNRLMLFGLVLGAPLAGLALDAVWRRSSRSAAARTVAWVAAVSVTIGAAAGWLAAGYGWPRRLVGPSSVATVDDWQARFVRRPAWAAEFRWAAGEVRAAGARRVGLVQSNDSWEYPWWLLLGDLDLRALQSQLTTRPPTPATEVDAIVCTTPQPVCAANAPPGWRVTYHGDIGVALPP